MNTAKHHLRARTFEMRTSRGLLRAFVAIVALASLPALASGQGTWTQLASIPDPPGPADGRTEGAAVSGVGDTIVVVGGHDGASAATNLTRIYDITTDTWSFGPASPIKAIFPASGATGHGGKIYVLGGMTTPLTLDVGNEVQEYNVDAETWTLKSPMPTARAGAAVVVMGNSLYVIGGRTKGGPCSGGSLSVMERYDIQSDVWITEASLPSPRSDFAAVAVGHKIYVFGGCAPNGSALVDVDVYDRSTGEWDTSPADLSIPRAALMAGRKGNAIYVMGGLTLATGPPSLSGLNERYDTVKDTWSVATKMPAGCFTVVHGRGTTGVYSHDGQIYVPAGGCPAFLWQPTNSLWVFNP